MTLLYMYTLNISSFTR